MYKKSLLLDFCLIFMSIFLPYFILNGLPLFPGGNGDFGPWEFTVFIFALALIPSFLMIFVLLIISRRQKNILSASSVAIISIVSVLFSYVVMYFLNTRELNSLSEIGNGSAEVLYVFVFPVVAYLYATYLKRKEMGISTINS